MCFLSLLTALCERSDKYAYVLTQVGDGAGL